PAEAKLASALAIGMSANEYADANSLSRNTVRAQTQALLQKMGARKQSDISRLMAMAFSGFKGDLLSKG
ncbi:helix-turn-helix transcriptional regulator, partial [Parasedimentitalea denitrificans]|uniref:helix-turn-helix transcriptional regulator n=1 Tax=Parasedimentitalea denitrificans TaxID=2211118 RepID=UPI0019814366